MSLLARPRARARQGAGLARARRRSTPRSSAARSTRTAGTPRSSRSSSRRTSAATTPQMQSGNSGDAAVLGARPAAGHGRRRPRRHLPRHRLRQRSADGVRRRGGATRTATSIEPYGVDISAGLAHLARDRCPQWADRIWTANAAAWQPPVSSTFVRTGLDYVPDRSRPAYVDAPADLPRARWTADPGQAQRGDRSRRPRRRGRVVGPSGRRPRAPGRTGTRPCPTRCSGSRPERSDQEMISEDRHHHERGGHHQRRARTTAAARAAASRVRRVPSARTTPARPRRRARSGPPPGSSGGRAGPEMVSACSATPPASMASDVRTQARKVRSLARVKRGSGSSPSSYTQRGCRVVTPPSCRSGSSARPPVRPRAIGSRAAVAVRVEPCAIRRSAAYPVVAWRPEPGGGTGDGRIGGARTRVRFLVSSLSRSCSPRRCPRRPAPPAAAGRTAYRPRSTVSVPAYAGARRLRARVPDGGPASTTGSRPSRPRARG